MLSPMRLSLRIRIPESPMEKQTLRSRSFRKIIVTLTALLLILLSVRSLASRATLHKVSPHEYFKFYQQSAHKWTSDSKNAPQSQQSPDDEDITTPATRPVKDDKHAEVQALIKQLPEIVRIPFEEAVADIDLEGWEDDWFSSGTFDPVRHGTLQEPKIDFVYNWVNGSEDEFKAIRQQYELTSPLNDRAGKWISRHSVNRYRDWDELRFSFRSLDRFAKNFINKIQLLVNSVPDINVNDTMTLRRQRPNWLRTDDSARRTVEVLAQEDFFDETEQACLPSFDSLSLETQIYNTPSNVDRLVALSDDMFLSAQHSAADFFSPLFGPMFAFKRNAYNVKALSKSDVPTFGEKPYLYYTSWLLNHRFGERDRKVQAHFTHAVSRRVMKEAMASFPSPALRGSCERFRGESKYQIYPWYAAFHYSIERFREALLWSFVMHRSDANGDGYLDWNERQQMLEVIHPGRQELSAGDASTPARTAEGRERIFYQMSQHQKRAGLQPPLSNINVLWTSLDGPETIRDVKCNNFHIDKCFAESFDAPISDSLYRNPDFSTANIFEQLTRHQPKCGDCVIKFLLSSAPRGLEPLLPPKTMRQERETVIKALVKYQHSVFEPDALFVMVKDAEQAETELLDRTIKREKQFSQWCLNDDVMTEDSTAVAKVNRVIQTVFSTMFPEKGRWEK